MIADYETTAECQPVDCDGCGAEFGVDDLTDGECAGCNPPRDTTEPDDHELPAMRRSQRHFRNLEG